MSAGLPGAPPGSSGSFRRSTPEDSAKRAEQRAFQAPIELHLSSGSSPGLGRGASRKSGFPGSPSGPRSPFAITAHNNLIQSPVGTACSVSPNNKGSPGMKEHIDIMSPTGGRRHLQRRSTSSPPPIGERNQAWGKYDTVQEIIARPQPPPAIQQGQHTTLSLQGGRWSYHQPVNELYVLSKISIQTPGPGHYRSTETVVAGKTTPFGKMNGGRVSTSPLRGHAHDLERVGRAVPGPGYYDTDHLFGMYGRIRAAIPRPQPSRENLIEPEDEFDEYENDSDSSYQDACSPKFLGDGTADEERGWVGDPIFDDGKETNPTVIEQRLVMSQAVPLEKMSRLGTTKYSKLRKEASAPKVRKVVRQQRSQSAMSMLSSLSPDQ